MGMNMHHIQVVLISEMGCHLENRWKMYHYLGRGQCVCLLPVLSLLVFLQAGFEFCTLAYSSSVCVCEFTFSLCD